SEARSRPLFLPISDPVWSPSLDATTAAGNVANRFNRIAFSIQPHCLITCARASSAAFPIRLFQFLSLFWAEFKLSFGHPFIVCLCSIFSMSISVMDQKARVALARLVLPGRAPDLLGDPGRVGTMGTASQVHAPCTHVN